MAASESSNLRDMAVFARQVSEVLRAIEPYRHRVQISSVNEVSKNSYDNVTTKGAWEKWLSGFSPSLALFPRIDSVLPPAGSRESPHVCNKSA